MKKWIIITIVAGTFALASIAFAQPSPELRDLPRDRPFPAERLLENRDLLEDLELGDEKVADLKEIHREAQKTTIELRAQLELGEIDLKAELESPEPDADAAMKAIERMGNARTEMQKTQVGVMLETRALLGPETWKKLQERMRNQMQERVEPYRTRNDVHRPQPPMEMRDGDVRRPVFSPRRTE